MAFPYPSNFCKGSTKVTSKTTETNYAHINQKQFLPSFNHFKGAYSHDN
jgi:hypothetical protein